jgi:hypothetical protein
MISDGAPFTGWPSAPLPASAWTATKTNYLVTE